MKGFIVRQHGGPEALSFENLPDPLPGAGEVRVRVRAAGLNHLDVWVRRGVPGHDFPLPLIPGNDAAGEVESVGPGIEHIKVGQRVVVAPGVSCGHCIACLSGRDQHCKHYGILGEHRHGACAELLVVPAANIVPIPDSLSFERAAAVGVAFITAWHMLVSRAELKPGETVLVQAGGSGVGSAAIQIAKLWGATVITTASTDAKLARAKELGAEHGINYTSQDVAKEVKRLTAGRGADVVVEHVGPATFPGSLRSLAWQGRLVTCGSTTGPTIEVNLRHLFFKSQSILGSTMGSKGELIEVLQHVIAGRLQPVIDRVLPFERLPEAYEALESRQVFGKIVVTP